MISLLKRREYIRDPLSVEKLPFRRVSRRGWNISGTKDTFLRAKKESLPRFPSIYRNSSGQLADQFYIPLNIAVNAISVQFIRRPPLYPEYLNIRDNISPARLASPVEPATARKENIEYAARPIFPLFSRRFPPFFYFYLRAFSLRAGLSSPDGWPCLFSWHSTKSAPKKVQGNLDGLTVLTLAVFFSSQRRAGEERTEGKKRRNREKRDETLVVFREKETTRR